MLSNLEVSVPNGGIIPLEDTSMIPLNWKLNLLSCHFGLLAPLNQKEKKGVTMQDEITDPHY